MSSCESVQMRRSMVEPSARLGRPRWLLALALLLGPLACPASPLAEPAGLRISLSVDDLPWQHHRETPPAWEALQQVALMQSLARAGVSAVGFVNEDQLDAGVEAGARRMAVLRDWLQAGHELGNHTYGHVDLHAVGVDAFQQAILAGERRLRPLLAEFGAKPRWFRHPYLRTGRSEQDRTAIEAFLHARGYRVAPVTIDNSDWIFAEAYRRALQGEAAAGERQAMLLRLREAFVPYLLAKVDYYAGQSEALLGYVLPQVLLLHANALVAHTLEDLVTGLRARGYRFVSLDEALADPAYARQDGYFGLFGPSWIHRWAIAERRPRAFFGEEPRVPDWVMAMAGVAAE